MLYVGLRAPPLEHQWHHPLHGGDLLLSHMVAEPQREGTLQLQPRGAEKCLEYEFWRLGNLSDVYRDPERHGEECQTAPGDFQNSRRDKDDCPYGTSPIHFTGSLYPTSIGQGRNKTPNVLGKRGLLLLNKQ